MKTIGMSGRLRTLVWGSEGQIQTKKILVPNGHSICWTYGKDYDIVCLIEIDT